MSHILFDARAIAEKSGGVSRVAERVLTHLRKTRPDDEIATITTGFIDSRVIHDRVQSLHLHVPNKLWSLACLLGLTSLDRVAAQMTKKTVDELILPNVGFVGVPKIPYTIVVHDLSFLIEPKWFPWKMRAWHRAVRASRLITNATHVWCVSDATKRDVMRLLNVDEKKIDVLPCEVMIGSNEEMTRDDSHPHNTRRYVIAFGDNNPRKNVATARVAIEQLKRDERFRDIELVIVGETIKPSDTELADLYRNASALLYPSWYEGFGLPLHEAAAYGVPILASNHGALPETAPPGSLLINPAKPQLWVAALRNTLDKKNTAASQ